MTYPASPAITSVTGNQIARSAAEGVIAVKTQLAPLTPKAAHPVHSGHPKGKPAALMMASA